MGPGEIAFVSGPSGSGKTTSLHAALGHINKPGIKIWTAEDPVEITQAGLRQVQVKPQIGLDFAKIMRGFLRLDSDIIMIGEMRDRETASIAIEASLTGHLVFSTLHTNDAAGSITRLLDMGVEDYLLTSTVNAILAQRLVRTLCTHCREAYTPLDEVVLRWGLQRYAGNAPVTNYAKAHYALALMGQDKKVKDGKLRFILARGIGEAFITSDVPREAVLAVLTDALRA